ncbi:MAG: aminoacyl-tRNA hydrolase [Acidimicrobiia bacterium]
MQVVVGLRNPGADYERSRHNVGFDVLARVVDRADQSFGRAPSRVRGMVAQSRVGEDRVLYFAPNTYMNESGGAVKAVMAYYKVASGDLLVIHDDIDLAFGRLRIQVAGGSGGHNGIRSVEESLGTKEFSRLKIGVGRPPGSMDPADFVLRQFSKGERSEVEVLKEDAADVAEQWLGNRDRAQEEAAHRGRDA